MAWAEKRVSTAKGRKGEVSWRVKFLLADGTYGSQSGFPTKKTALAYGRKQEDLLKSGRQQMSTEGPALFGPFARQYMKDRQKRGRTNSRRWDYLKEYILPRWESTEIRAITWYDVDTWQLKLPCDDVTRGHTVSLMSTIITAAVDSQKVEANPIYGRRRTKPAVELAPAPGTQAGDKAAKARRKASVWSGDGVRPEDVFLLAERLGPANGVHVLAVAFTGLRWGESLGLHRDNARRQRRQPWGADVFECPIISVVEEIAEYEQRDDEGRKAGTFIGLEPTKTDGETRDVDVPPSLARLLERHLWDWPHERAFCTPSGKPWRRGNWGRTLRPAADGRDERKRRQGVSYREAWEPICPGLDMRALRHLHDTLQAEIDVAEPLAFEAMGHRRPGIKRVYQHVTPEMRQHRLDGLEEVWQRAMRNVGLRTLWSRVDLLKSSQTIKKARRLTVAPQVKGGVRVA
ncbi:hypothetical protein [Streptomyces sp. NPDC047968]|uniref:hypothetical protein n=1 Tax=unclassified Streptomyces TaxID=2593676 RepID=UPI00343D9737